jgi:hypothetical protein
MCSSCNALTNITRQNDKQIRLPHLPHDSHKLVMLTNVFIIDEHVHYFNQHRLFVIRHVDQSNFTKMMDTFVNMTNVLTWDETDEPVFLIDEVMFSSACLPLPCQMTG